MAAGRLGQLDAGGLGIQEAVQPRHVRRTTDQAGTERHGQRRQQHGQDDGHQQIVGQGGAEEVESGCGVQEHEGEFADLA